MPPRLATYAGLAIAGCLALVPPTPARAADEGPRTLVTLSAHPLTPTEAPADQYFGRLKLSNLGIRNIIHALAVEGNSPLALPLEQTRIMGVQTAIVEWSERYPRDPWLPRAMLNFGTVLLTKRDPQTDAIAIDMLLSASQRFDNTAVATTALNRLRGITPDVGADFDWTIVPFDPPTLGDLVDLQVGRL